MTPKKLKSIKHFLSKYFFINESGASAVEYGLLVGIIAVVLILVLSSMRSELGINFNENKKLISDTIDKNVSKNGKSDKYDSNIIKLALITALLAGIGWNVKQGINALNKRAQLLILEILSDGKQKSREEIELFLKREFLVYRIINIHLDALAELIIDHRIFIQNKLYKINSEMSLGVVSKSHSGTEKL